MNSGKGQWITLKEASEISGKSINALRLQIHRGKIDNLRKVKGKGHGEWLIHKDYVAQFDPAEISENLKSQDTPIEMTTLKSQDNSEHAISLQYFDKKLNEWETERDKLVQGLMMYRYKFEDLERQIKLLPAPPEVLTSELEQKAQALAQAEKIIEDAKEAQQKYQESMTQLKAKLQEEEHAKEAFRIQWEQAMAEAKRPWWKKLFGVK